MDLYAVIDQVVALLQQRGRLTYRALKVEFGLSEEQLEAIKEELIDGQEAALDKDGKMLVWKGTAAEQETKKGKNGEGEPRHSSSSADAQTDRRHEARRAEAERR